MDNKSETSQENSSESGSEVSSSEDYLSEEEEERKNNLRQYQLKYHTSQEYRYLSSDNDSPSASGEDSDEDIHEEEIVKLFPNTSGLRDQRKKSIHKITPPHITKTTSFEENIAENMTFPELLDQLVRLLKNHDKNSYYEAAYYHHYLLNNYGSTVGLEASGKDQNESEEIKNLIISLTRKDETIEELSQKIESQRLALRNGEEQLQNMEIQFGELSITAKKRELHLQETIKKLEEEKMGMKKNQQKYDYKNKFSQTRQNLKDVGSQTRNQPKHKGIQTLLTSSDDISTISQNFIISEEPLDKLDQQKMQKIMEAMSYQNEIQKAIITEKEQKLINLQLMVEEWQVKAEVRETKLKEEISRITKEYHEITKEYHEITKKNSKKDQKNKFSQTVQKTGETEQIQYSEFEKLPMRNHSTPQQTTAKSKTQEEKHKLTDNETKTITELLQQFERNNQTFASLLKDLTYIPEEHNTKLDQNTQILEPNMLLKTTHNSKSAIIIRRKITTEQTMNELQKLLSEEVERINDFPVVYTRQSRDKTALIINTSTDEEIPKVEKIISSIEGITELADVEISHFRKKKIIILGIPRQIAPREVVESINTIIQKKITTKNMKIQQKSEREKYQIILDLDAATADALLRIGTLNHGFYNSRITSYLPILRCGNCQRFGHTQNRCRSTPNCAKCMQGHQTTNCSADPGTRACINCFHSYDDKGHQISYSHRADSSQCQTYKYHYQTRKLSQNRRKTFI